MSLDNLFIFRTYYQILNKTIIRNKGFHFIFNFIDNIILLLKILDVYNSYFIIANNSSIKYINVVSILSKYSIIYKLLIITIYLIISYAIFISYNIVSPTKKCNRFDVLLINFFEFFLVRLLVSFYLDILFSLYSLYFLLLLILSLPFFVLIFRNMTFFHLTGFMPKIIVFPFDDFTSLCDRQKLFIKIIISVSFVRKNYYITKFMFLLQIIFYVIFLLYDSYIIIYKSYYLMNNELITKTKYSHLLSMTIIQILLIFLKHEEAFKISFLIIVILIMVFSNFFILLYYNPYNYIIIDNPSNRENAFYYFFLVDRNKNVTFFLEEKIKDHIYRCDFCQLCKKYHYLFENNIKEKKEINDIDDFFNILYDGKDKSMVLINQITNNIKKLGHNYLYINNSYYIINLIYSFYYTSKMGDITLSLNQLLLYNFLQENNKSLITIHKISIKQILAVNEFFKLYKKVILIIKEILSKKNLKRYINKFFDLSKQLRLLNSSKFKDNIYGTKNDGASNCSYLLTICSLLYEELFNKTLSNYSIPIRENAQLHEDLIKKFLRQDNNITLNMNLKTLECKIINSGKDLFYFINYNFYDLFPNQLKEILIQYFSDFILNAKDNNHKRNTKHNKAKYIEPILLIYITKDDVKYYRLLSLKLALLFNDHLDKDILLSGFFQIENNILITINKKQKKERIVGYGSKDIMNEAIKSNFNFKIFKKSNFMKNKSIHSSNTIALNNTDFFIYIITEIKKKKSKLSKFEKTQKMCSSFENNKESSNQDKKNDNYISNIVGSEQNDKNSEEITNNESSKNKYNINDFLEDTVSQSSALTGTSGNGFWKANKSITKDIQNSFSSKKFLNLQLLLAVLLVALLVLMIVLIIQLQILKQTLSKYYNNYFDLHQFVRTFQQFSFGFMAEVCLVIDNYGNCKEYLTNLDTELFNQTLYINEQNIILADFCSDSIAKIIMNSEEIKDKKLIELFEGNISYRLVNRRNKEGIYYLTHSSIDTSFSESLLLLSNNMRIITSTESKIKTRNKEPIYLISGLEEPFQNVKSTSEEISDFQIAVYTYLINYKLFVVRFSDLNTRLNELINIENVKGINILNIFQNIIFIVMIFQIFTILFYLLTFNGILAQIINSIILKIGLIFDDGNDFKKLYLSKIYQLESIATIYSNNPVRLINEINKNNIKYKNLMAKKKKIEHHPNINKRLVEEENENLIFKNQQKYINWIEIYKNGNDRFYILFTIMIALIDIIVYGIIFGICINYKTKSKDTLELIYNSWNFERNTLRLVNFYNTMIFNNRTLEDLKNDYHPFDSYSTIENLYQILYSYYDLRKKRHKIPYIYRSFSFFCDYNCKSLYDVMESLKENSFAQTLIVMKEKYGIDSEEIKKGFVDECEEINPFIGNSVSPAFQNLYQKVSDAMILRDNRTYVGIINEIFNSSFPKLSSIFLNVIRYILYIVGKVTYTYASNKIIEILGNYIVITLILYILSEISLFIFFFFIYIWNINTECKNMYALKNVFEITNSIEN